MCAFGVGALGARFWPEYFGDCFFLRAFDGLSWWECFHERFCPRAFGADVLITAFGEHFSVGVFGRRFW